MYIYSGAGESPVFQSAVYAVRAHVLVLASDRISLYKKKRRNIERHKHGVQIRNPNPG